VLQCLDSDKSCFERPLGLYIRGLHGSACFVDIVRTATDVMIYIKVLVSCDLQIIHGTLVALHVTAIKAVQSSSSIIFLLWLKNR
jgi:hypothetical protein